ncbi:SepM family pheromone-processing serine protease [Halalkalibacter urbisdiaboli]|uniref:SepM family pheromone-processing serine protease n=1 Tax=Halalkalibacter urbisdiaboli TaxID=1960589 RepID=UPI000B4367C5|nr:SepM family pheromone-processing serine protease [Halalkalibacter urbisdiaboli]
MKERQQPMIKKRWLFLFGILLFLHFFQLPYYYSQPGHAKQLESIIVVEDGYNEEEGSFMLTTIRMGKANAFFYVWAHLSPYRNLYPEEQLRHEDETEEEYQQRQIQMMTDSQEVAKIVAYEKAGKQVDYEYHGVLVSSFIEGMPAEKLLEPGDRVLQVDGKKVLTAEAFMSELQGKTASDSVKLMVLRDNREIEVELGFASFPESMGVSDERVGVGIRSPITDRDVTFQPKVEIDTSEIGGPSAGLMFALEIYNQLVEKDITKGYEIAGTGTINEQGEVGRIGGAAQKVIAADKAGADYFLAPNEKGAPTSNYQEALEAAKDTNSTIKVIPIDTFEEALDFLESLPNKAT